MGIERSPRAGATGGSAAANGGRASTPGKRTLTQDLLPAASKSGSAGGKSAGAGGAGGASGASGATGKRSDATAGAASASAGGPGQPDGAPGGAASAHGPAASDPGQPLPTSIRNELAAKLGNGVSDVRVHVGSSAAAAARTMGANAYAVGKDIYFAAGTYQPDTAEGRKLIAHEVAHAIQAGGGGGGALTKLSEPGDSHERSAETFAEAFSSGNAAAPALAPGTAPAGTIHREKDPKAADDAQKTKEQHEKLLADIQGLPMAALLPALKGISDDAARKDYAAAHVGGPRLEAAMRAVNEPSDWKTYITKYQGVAGHLPADQLDDLMHFLGGPSADFRYYKDVGNYDGSVDAGAKVVTLYWRVKFVSAKKLADPDFDDLSPAEVAEIANDSKHKIESIWSGKGTIKSAAPSMDPFATKVVVEIVETGQHSTITLQTGAQTGQDAKSGNRNGTWDPGVKRDTSHTGIVYDKDGKQINTGTITQSAVAHEFGHAIGLPHVDDVRELEDKLRQDGQDGHKMSSAERKRIEQILKDHQDMANNINKDSIAKTGHGDYGGARLDAEYGSTQEEQENIMGKGNQVKVIGGADPFDPFVAFEKIAHKWGEEFLKAPNLNKWTASNS